MVKINKRMRKEKQNKTGESLLHAAAVSTKTEINMKKFDISTVNDNNDCTVINMSDR